MFSCVCSIGYNGCVVVVTLFLYSGYLPLSLTTTFSTTSLSCIKWCSTRRKVKGLWIHTHGLNRHVFVRTCGHPYNSTFLMNTDDALIAYSSSFTSLIIALFVFSCFDCNYCLFYTPYSILLSIYPILLLFRLLTVTKSIDIFFALLSFYS